MVARKSRPEIGLKVIFNTPNALSLYQKTTPINQLDTICLQLKAMPQTPLLINWLSHDLKDEQKRRQVFCDLVHENLNPEFITVLLPTNQETIEQYLLTDNKYYLHPKLCKQDIFKAQVVKGFKLEISKNLLKKQNTYQY